VISPPGPGEPWTVLHLIRWSAEYLEGKGVKGGRLDAEHLLAHSLGVQRLDLYLQFDRPLTGEELAGFRERLRRRARREPLQYIRGDTSFRELELRTDRRALIPRPETEELVGLVLEWVGGAEGGKGRELSALDLGTGSGAIALSLALEGPFARVLATDSSADALELARENRDRVSLPEGVEVEFRCGSLFDPLTIGERFHVVVSNPPYVAEEDGGGLEPEVGEWEPAGALFAGAGGVAVLEPLVAGAGEWMHPGGLLALEVGSGQGGWVAERIRDSREFHLPRVARDLSGKERFILAVRTGGD